MREPAGLGLAAQVVAVVEEHGAARLHREQRPHVPRHRAACAPHVIRRIRCAQRPSLLEREPGGDVALERIVRRCLIGRSIGLEAAAHQRGMHFGRVADEPDTERAACRLRLARPRQRLLQAGRDAVAVAGRVAPLRARCVHLHRQAHATVHRDRERLCSSHATEAGGEHDASRERAAEVTRRALGEGLERALHDALRADVDPRPGCHLAEHHEALALELPEMLPGRPAHPLGCGRRRPACPTGPAASRRSRGSGGLPQCARTPPSSAPPCLCRRTPRDPRGARPHRDPGCSSTCAAPPPGSSRGTSAGSRAARAPRELPPRS